MKKNLFVGVDFIGDEEIRVNADVKKISKWATLKKKIGKFLNKLMFLNKDILYIEARYDKSITNFFVFFKFMVDFSILTFIGFLYL